MTVTWPPRVPWRKHDDEGEDQAVEETAAAEDEDVEPADEPEDQEDEEEAEPEWHQLPPEVHHHYYGVPAPQPGTGEGTPAPAGRRGSRGSARAWWKSLTPWQRFVLRTGACAAAGAWGPGLFTGNWDAGLPQTVMAVMDGVAAGSAEPSTPFVAGGLILLGSAVAGGIVIGFCDRWFARGLPAFCRLVRLAVHVPVASAAVAVLLFTAAR